MQRVAVAIVCRGGSFDGGGEDSLDADAIAAHDRHDFFAIAIQDCGTHGLRILVTKLEDVADLDSFANLERLAAGNVEVPFIDVRISATRVQVKSRPGVMLR